MALILRPGSPASAGGALSPPDLLLIQRAESPRDPWSGHMALPGGRLEAQDPHLLATAVRETLEETGLALLPRPPREGGWMEAGFLGHLPEVAPVGPRLPRISVVPHVFSTEPEARAHPASREVARVEWVSLSHFADPRHHDQVEIPLPIGTRRFPCYRVGDEVVWGLTYRIVTDLLARLG